MAGCSVSIEANAPRSLLLRVHPREGGVLGDPYVLVCTADDRGGGTAWVKGLCGSARRAPGYREAVKQRLAESGFSAIEYSEGGVVVREELRVTPAGFSGEVVIPGSWPGAELRGRPGFLRRPEVTVYHPVFYTLCRIAVRGELRRQGYSRHQINQAMDAYDDVLVDSVCQQLGTSPPVGGPILDALIEFLKSDAGKALIQALVKLLIGLIAF